MTSVPPTMAKLQCLLDNTASPSIGADQETLEYLLQFASYYDTHVEKTENTAILFSHMPSELQDDTKHGLDVGEYVDLSVFTFLSSKFDGLGMHPTVATEIIRRGSFTCMVDLTDFLVKLRTDQTKPHEEFGVRYTRNFATEISYLSYLAKWNHKLDDGTEVMPLLDEHGAPTLAIFHRKTFRDRYRRRGGNTRTGIIDDCEEVYKAKTAEMATISPVHLQDMGYAPSSGNFALPYGVTDSTGSPQYPGAPAPTARVLFTGEDGSLIDPVIQQARERQREAMAHSSTPFVPNTTITPRQAYQRSEASQRLYTNHPTQPPGTPVRTFFQPKASSISASLQPVLANPLHAKLINRQIVPARLKWNGRIATIRAFIIDFEGFMFQAGIGHLIARVPLEYYRKHGSDSFIRAYGGENMQVTHYQLNHDITYLYGSLMTSIQGTSGYRVVQPFYATQDGLLAWYAFLKDYENSGHRRAMEEQIRMDIWNSKYDGKTSLVQFIDALDAKIVQLDQLNDMATPDGEKVKMLYQSLRYPTLVDLTSRCRQIHHDYTPTLTYLRQEATEIALSSITHRTSLLTYVNEYMEGQTSDHQAHASSDFRMPTELWKNADDSLRKQWIDLVRKTRNANRDAIKNEGTQGHDRSLPAQYGSRASTVASTAHTEATLEGNEEDPDTAEAEQLWSYFSGLTDFSNIRQGGMSVSCQWSFSHLEYCAAFEGMSSKVGYAVSDAGADTHICGGSHWHVTHEYAGMKANVIGFDSHVARKFGLQIADALTYIVTSDYKGLAIAHSAIQNPSSNTTLLSEYQMRHHGLIVDSTYHRHRGADGKPGRQHIVSKDDSATIPLTLTRGLMNFTIRRPTQTEADDFLQGRAEAVELSENAPWNPMEHSESPTRALYQALCLRGETSQPESDEEIKVVLPGASMDPHEDNVNLKDMDTDIKKADTHAAAGEADNKVSVEPEDEDEFVDAATASKEAFDSVNMQTELEHFMDTETIPPKYTPHLDATDGYFFDPTDSVHVSPMFGRAFHLKIDYQTSSPGTVVDDSFLRGDQVEEFLHGQSTDQLCGRGDAFDTLSYAVESSLQHLRDLEGYQPYLAYKPIEVIKRTLDNTTQLNKIEWRYPLRRHQKTRFARQRQRVLHETISTDGFSSGTKDISGNSWLQCFYGCVSHCINVEPLHGKGQFPDAYNDFIRKHGIPSVLRRDLAGEEMSAVVTEINRNLHVKDEWSEAHNQQQNKAELGAVRWLKDHLKIMLARTNAPKWVWIQACEYLANVHNILAHDALSGRTPFSYRMGYPPDISAYLHFRFWQKVLFLDTEDTFPSTKERPGYWLGVADSVGDVLTFKILTADTMRIIYRSVVRPGNDLSKPNLHVTWPKMDADVPRIVDDTDDTYPTDIEEHPRLSSDNMELPITQSKRATKRNQQRSRTRKHKVKWKDVRQFDLTPKTETSTDSETVPTVPHTDEQTTTVPSAPVVSETTSLPSPSPLDPLSWMPDHGATQNEELETSTQTTKSSDPTSQTVRYPGRKRKKVQRMDLTSSSTRFMNFVRYMIPGLFITASTNAFCFPNCNMTFPGPPQADIDHHFPDMEITPITVSLDHLQYLQACDQWYDTSTGEDIENANWKPFQILDHKVINTTRRRPSKKDVFTTPHMRMQVQWPNQTTSWIQAEALMSSDPLMIVLYAKHKKLFNKPGFHWTKSYIQRSHKLQKLVQVCKAASRGPRYKFGVQVPFSPKHALAMDQREGNNLWKEAMTKELKQINDYQTFRILEDDEALSSEYQKIPYHFVFDVKFDLRRKARLVAGGNFTDPLREDIYSGVVGMDTIRLGFLLAATHGLSVCAADVGNAFLYGKTREKVYVIAGPEFGEHAGKRMIIDRGLYGLKSSAARFHEHLSTKLRSLGFTPSTPDSDFWMRKQDGHYEYIATYVDDLLVMSKKPLELIETLRKDYILKGVGAPEYYLGGNVEDVSEHWKVKDIHTALSARTYITNVCQKLETMLDNKPFPKVKAPMPEESHPELDDTPMLSTEDAAKYRALIGSANWIVTLGRFDIAYATNTLSRFSMAPREGHLALARKLFGYLKHHPKGKIIIDASFHDWSLFPKESGHDTWSEFYPDAQELLPTKIPIPLGPELRITVYVDADHAHDQATRRSVTGILVFINNTPIKWISKRQATVESSTYGSELVAARIASDIIVEYRYTLRMLGAPIKGPSLMLGDNMSVILNTTVPSSLLKKKHLGCAYHRVRECIAADIFRFVHIPSESNYADILTKPLGPSKFSELIKPLLFRTPPHLQPTISQSN